MMLNCNKIQISTFTDYWMLLAKFAVGSSRFTYSSQQQFALENRV